MLRRVMLPHSRRGRLAREVDANDFANDFTILRRRALIGVFKKESAMETRAEALDSPTPQRCLG
jgi:hypothetical protein